MPPGVRLITMTVDVQRKRLIYVVRGWGVRGTSWLVDHGELIGDTAEPDVWDDLATLISEPIAGKRLRLVLVDSGFRPGKPINVPVNRVYAFARKFPRLVRITKGRDTQAKPVISSAIEVKEDGSLKKYGLELLWLDTDYCKSWVHERIRWPSGQPGAWYLPGDIAEEYCKQIVAEARVRKPSGRPQWVQRARENHYLDCEAMQAAASHLLNVHLIRGPDPDEPPPSHASLSSEPPKPASAPPQAPVSAPPRSVLNNKISAALRAAAIARFYR
jgi:phage terminase large subunit GpA-like protein